MNDQERLATIQSTINNRFGRAVIVIEVENVQWLLNAFGRHEREIAQLKADRRDKQLEDALNVGDFFINPNLIEHAADEIDCEGAAGRCSHAGQSECGEHRHHGKGWCNYDLAEMLRAVAKVARERQQPKVEVTTIGGGGGLAPPHEPQLGQDTPKTPLALRHSDIEQRLADLAHHWAKKGFPTDAACYTLASKFILELRAALIIGADWQPIETAPKDEMFIYGVPNGPGKWQIGLAYRNVSDGWSCAYGSDAPRNATVWASLPAPPESRP